MTIVLKYESISTSLIIGAMWRTSTPISPKTSRNRTQDTEYKPKAPFKLVVSMTWLIPTDRGRIKRLIKVCNIIIPFKLDLKNCLNNYILKFCNT